VGVGDIERHSDPQRSPPLWLAVVERAEARWGVVSRAELLALGASGARINAWRRRGRLRVLHRGVYAVGHRRLRPEGHRLAAVLACGPGAVLSHTSAAAHWNLLTTAQTRIDVTAPRARRGAPGIRLHRSRSLDAQDATQHDGIPTTTVARTLLDLAATGKPSRLENALAQAMRQELYDHNAIEHTIARANGHRGTGTLQRAIAHDLKLTRSEYEARFLKLLRDAGLPEPQVNVPLTALDDERYEVDFYWPSHRLVVELDGWETHGTRAAFRRDRARDAALTAAGFRVLRFTWDTEPATALRRVSTLLAP
jgi:very-short-patch-repair endonuclease